MANSSSTSAFPNSPAANTTRNVGFGSELFGRQTTFSSAVATQPQPFGSYQCGGDHQVFGTNPGTGDFQNPWPYGWAGFPLSGNQQFGSQFRLGSSAATTSPFGNESPSYGSSSSTFGTISSGFRSSTTGPYTRSLVQENTSANNASLFAPFTGSNLGISDIQGTRICSYAPTPEADDNFSSGNLISISAMPFYQEKSHEELRSEDYQLTGRTISQFSLGSSAATTSPFGNESPSYSSSSSTFGTISSGFRSSTTGPYTRSLFQENTSAKNVSVFAPFTGSNLGISDIQGTRICSYAPTPEADDNFSSRNLISISAMPFYQEKSHEELRSEDYELTGRTISQFSLGSSAATTSPFGNESPSYSSSSSTFGTISSGFRSSTTGPFTRSLFQENTSANNVSVNLGISGIQGSRICSYAPTPVVDSFYKSNMVSISAMPFYQEKSHEELRAEDYQLTGKTDKGRSGCEGTKWSCEKSPVEGKIPASNATFSISTMPFNKERGHEELRSAGDNRFTGNTCGYATGAESSSSFPVINVSISVSSSLVSNSSSSSSTGAIPGFSFSNPSASDSLCLGSSVSSTCTSLIPTPSLPLHHPVISIPPSVKIGHSGDLFTASQPTYPVPTSGTVPASSNATVTESIITSLPEPVSTGGFAPRFHCSTDNRQQPISQCPVSVGQSFVVNPVATEARVTPPTVQHGISSLLVSENADFFKGKPPMMNDRPLSLDQRTTPPIDKYKQDDEDVIAMIPKLKRPEYFMEPSMDDLVANELKRPGFCRQVKDFVIGKRGYGSIKFLGETDVRNLDLESIVQFNIREVMFCMDEKAKPPVGQGLNKAAEITLLNVDCIDKNTGKQYIDGPKVDQYKQLLMRKTVDQGAEFVSFDPAKGEWKFKVQHF